jgi:hypothetical protein
LLERPAAVLVTVMVYVVVDESPAVAIRVIVFAPIVRDCAADALSEDTDTPLTVTVAAVSVTVGVTVTDSTLFGTSTE